jgi:hypothetical protein
VTTTARRPLVSVALPAEHGGWSLTLEPAILGLLVAPSAAGWALAGAALVAFVARTPIKLALVDRWRRRRLPRTELAERVAAVEMVVLAALLVVAAATAHAAFWAPLAVAAPLVGVELWYDVRSRSRRLVPELAGTVGIGAVAASIVLAGGGATTDAMGAWWIVAARAVAAIPFVRFQLRRAKGHTESWWRNGRWQAAAVAMAGVGLVAGPVPLAGFAAIVVLTSFHAAAAMRPVPRVPIVGAQQVVLGLGVVVATALGLAAP